MCELGTGELRSKLSRDRGHTQGAHDVKVGVDGVFSGSGHAT